MTPVAALAETTGGPLDDWMRGAIEDGTASAALLATLHTGRRRDLEEPVARAALSGDPTPFTRLSVALVAEREGRIVGALYALPPGGFIADIIGKGVDQLRASVVALAAIKIKAVAVEPDARPPRRPGSRPRGLLGRGRANNSDRPGPWRSVPAASQAQ